MPLNVYRRMNVQNMKTMKFCTGLICFTYRMSITENKDYHMHIKKFFFVLKILSSRYPK